MVARYEDGHVIWEVGDLADGTEARVEFVVWPKQEAYDLVAALNNGEVTYDETTMGESIVNNGDGTYSLKTNKKDPKLSYTVVTKKTNAAGEVISEDRTPGETILTNPDPVGLTDYSFVISKQWEDILDTSQIEDIDSVELTLHRDDEVMENSIVLDKEHDWKLAKEIHIAPGVMINKNSETAAVINRSGEYNDKIVGDYIILEDGQTYQIWKPELLSGASIICGIGCTRGILDYYLDEPTGLGEGENYLLEFTREVPIYNKENGTGLLEVGIGNRQKSIRPIRLKRNEIGGYDLQVKNSDGIWQMIK